MKKTFLATLLVFGTVAASDSSEAYALTHIEANPDQLSSKAYYWDNESKKITPMFFARFQGIAVGFGTEKACKIGRLKRSSFEALLFTEGYSDGQWLYQFSLGNRGLLLTQEIALFLQSYIVDKKVYMNDDSIFKEQPENLEERAAFFERHNLPAAALMLELGRQKQWEPVALDALLAFLEEKMKTSEPLSLEALGQVPSYYDAEPEDSGTCCSIL